MEQVEEKIRKQCEHIIFACIIACFILDIGFFIYYKTSNLLETSVPRYLLTRIAAPLIINTIVYLLTRFVNRSNIKTSTKNAISAFSLCTMGGCFAVVHGYFTPLWVAPCIALVYSSVFRSKTLQIVLFLYCCLFVPIAGVYMIHEHPGNNSVYIQNAIVVQIMLLVYYYISRAVANYSNEIQKVTIEATKQRDKIEDKLKYDNLTKVYSRDYFTEKISKLPYKNKEQAYLALVEISHFRWVNDSYGAPNADKVLESLAKLLNTRSSEKTIVGRFGGAKFVVLVPDIKYFQTICEDFEKVYFDFSNYSFPIAIGVTKYSADTTFEANLKKADDALHKAKVSGKSTVMNYEDI